MSNEEKGQWVYLVAFGVAYGAYFVITLGQLGQAAPADIDYVSFDHLHVQDLRLTMGTTNPVNGERAPTESISRSESSRALTTSLGS